MARLVRPIQGPLRPVHGHLEVRNAVMAATTVEFLSDSSNRRERTLEIAGILPCHDRVQEGEEQQFTRTPIYIVYAHRANSGLCLSSTWVDRALPHLRDVSIPNNVRELRDRCFYKCKSLRCVNFDSSRSLERIGVECFYCSGVKEVSIPDGLRELCEGCFSMCESLRRVNFSSSSSLERIGVSCFKGSAVEEVSIPDGVRELCNSCFFRCWRLRRVNFGPSSSLERIGVSCFESSGVEAVSIPDGVRELCDRCFSSCRRLRRVNFGSSSSLERIGFGAFPMSVSYLCDPVSVK